jgi:hypothetical protein
VRDGDSRDAQRKTLQVGLRKGNDAHLDPCGSEHSRTAHILPEIMPKMDNSILEYILARVTTGYPKANYAPCCSCKRTTLSSSRRGEARPVHAGRFINGRGR